MKEIFNEAFEILYQALPNFVAIAIGSIILAVVVFTLAYVFAMIGLFYGSGYRLRYLPYYISEYFHNLRQRTK